jgi:hypothetical protein
MEDILKSIKATLYVRLSSSFYGTFVFSWILINWKIWATLFLPTDELLGRDRIQLIEENYINIDNLVNYPLLSAIFLITVVPICAHFLERISLLHKKRLRELKQSFEQNERLTVEQSIELKRQVFDIEARYHNLLKEKSAENEILKNEIQANLKERVDAENNSNPENEIEEYPDKSSFSGLVHEKLSLLMELSIAEVFEEIVLKIKNSEWIKIDDQNVRTFLKLDLIAATGRKDSNGRQYYKVTPIGKSVIKLMEALQKE